MKYLVASQTQIITVGPFLSSADGVTLISLGATVSSVMGGMHMNYRGSTTAPGLVTFSPTSTATYTVAGAMAEKASSTGMYTLVITPTLTAWRGDGKLTLTLGGTVPYWDDVFCGTATNLDGYFGTDFLPVNTVQVGGSVAASANEIASAVWAEATATTAMVGVNLVTIQSATCSATTAHFGVQVVGLSTTGSALTAVPWNAAWAAQVNGEVVDALNVDQYGELGQVAPSVSVPLTYKIGWLYKLARNKVVTTATNVLVYDNAGTTVDHKFPISDDGTTFTRGEAITGA